MQVSVAVYSQATRFSFKAEDKPVLEVLRYVEKSSHYRFFFLREQVDVERKVTVKVLGASVEQILEELFKDQPISYEFANETLIILTNHNNPLRSTNEYGKDNMSQPAVTGKVTDMDRFPLSEVSVLVKGTKQGTVTNSEGNFSLMNVPKNATLVFSFIGMRTQEVGVDNQKAINIVMEMDAIGIEEVISIGYGTRRKKSLTGAISIIDGEDMKLNPAPNVTHMLGGKIPGLISVNYSGQPGADGNKLLIRGLGTLGDNNPLVIVDGIDFESIDRLDPNDIESISVLKDASAAIYGSKAANGVVVVTTKRGIAGKPIIEYGYNYGLAQSTLKPVLANAYELNKFINSVFSDKNEPDKQMSDADLEKLRRGSDPDNYFANTDWWEAVVRNNAPVQRHTASVRGGTEEIKYFVSAGHLDQEGLFKNGIDDFKQYNFRTNLDFQINEYVNIGANIYSRFDDWTKPNFDMWAIWSSIQSINPRFPTHFTSGLPWEGKEDGNNPVMMVSNAGGKTNKKTNIFQSMATYEVKIPKVDGLSIDGWYSIDKLHSNERRQQYPWTVYGKKNEEGINPPVIGKQLAQISLKERTDWSQSLSFNTKINYVRKFGNHEVNTFIAYEQNRFESKWISGFRSDLISIVPDAQLFMGSQLGQTADGSAYKNSRQNYISRLSYNYLNKYYIDATFRRDGSPIFPKHKRFGNFPGVAVSWRISEENFLKTFHNFTNYLKIRASWGQLGNDRVAEYQYLTAYNYLDAQVVMGSNHNVLPAFYPGVNANPNITWEVAENKNVGIDGNIFGGVLELQFDLFSNSRTNILIPRNASIPDYIGLNLPQENLGKMRNQGYEIMMTHTKKMNDLVFRISGNYSYNINEVVYIDETPNVLEWQKRTGKPYGAELYYKTDGLYTIADISNTELPKYGGAKAGDIKVLDYDNDGEISGDDRVRMDKSIDIPRVIYGFSITSSYKAFDFNMEFQGAEKVYRHLKPATSIGLNGNFLKTYVTDYWSEDNPDARWPRANSNGFGISNNNDFFIFPAGYLRLNSVDFGYSIPLSFLNKVDLDKIRIYFNGSNLLLLYNKLKYYDPEVAESSGYHYPRQRIFNIGVNVVF
jgi:TonB-dependent starch-binding outer membrane protein SusC